MNSDRKTRLSVLRYRVDDARIERIGSQEMVFGGDVHPADLIAGKLMRFGTIER
jgi:hypothetical protein